MKTQSRKRDSAARVSRVRKFQTRRSSRASIRTDAKRCVCLPTAVCYVNYQTMAPPATYQLQRDVSDSRTSRRRRTYLIDLGNLGSQSPLIFRIPCRSAEFLPQGCSIEVVGSFRVGFKGLVTRLRCLLVVFASWTTISCI